MRKRSEAPIEYPWDRGRLLRVRDGEKILGDIKLEAFSYALEYRLDRFREPYEKVSIRTFAYFLKACSQREAVLRGEPLGPECFRLKPPDPRGKGFSGGTYKILANGMRVRAERKARRIVLDDDYFKFPDFTIRREKFHPVFLKLMAAGVYEVQYEHLKKVLKM